MVSINFAYQHDLVSLSTLLDIKHLTEVCSYYYAGEQLLVFHVVPLLLQLRKLHGDLHDMLPSLRYDHLYGAILVGSGLRYKKMA